MAASIGSEVLRAEHVEKSFGRIVALKDVNLRLRRGEVLGLLGDNGAGKSTLMKIFTGFFRPSAGQLYFDRDPVQFRSVSHARSLGIEAVYQDLALVIDSMSTATCSFSASRCSAASWGFSTNVRCAVGRSRCSSVCASGFPPLMLMSPSSREDNARPSRSPDRCSKRRKCSCSTNRPPQWGEGVGPILDLIQRLKDGGEIAMIIVAHNYSQIFDVCDRINLVEGGMIAFDKSTSETSVQELTERVVRQYRSVREITRHEFRDEAVRSGGDSTAEIQTVRPH